MQSIGINDRFIAEEYFEGVPLAALAEKLNRQQKIDLVKDVAGALFYMHQSNFLYLDLKPENILCSIDGDNIIIKLIDFGLSRHSSEIQAGQVFGSTHFIAPEILNGEAYGYKADMYSLGVLMYLLFYNRYPFDFDDPLDIYKAQLEGRIVFPEYCGEPELNNVIRNLLSRNPDDRYESILMVLHELCGGLPGDFADRWSFPATFAGRASEMKSVEEFLSGKSGLDFLILKGQKGSGKSALLKKLMSEIENAVLIDVGNFNFLDSLNNNFLRNLYYNSYVNMNIPEDIRTEIDSIISSGRDCGIEKTKSLLSKISGEVKIIILLDDYDELGDFYGEYLGQILPIFLINGSKLIITVASDCEIALTGEKAPDLLLGTFGRAQVDEYIDKNFAPIFPLNEMKEYTLNYSRLYPGDIAEFIVELVRNGVVGFTGRGVEIPPAAEQDAKLKHLQGNYFAARMNSLTAIQTALLEAAAAMNINPGADIFAQIIDESAEETLRSLYLLDEKKY